MATEDPVVAPASTDVGKKKRETKARKASVGWKPTHPPYFEMITEAIATLKERSGSSQQAIQKFIEDKHKQLPPTFRKFLLVHLKKSVAAEKLVKVKGSYKLPPVRQPAKKSESSAAAPAKKATRAGKPGVYMKKAGAAGKKAAPAKKAKSSAATAPAKATRAGKPAAKTEGAKAKAKAPKSKPAAKTSAKAKPKASAPAAKTKANTKSKAKAAGKPKAAPKRKAAEKPKEKPAKVAKTSARSTPSKKPAAAAKKAAAPAKRAPAKGAKSSATRSSARKAKK